MNVPPFPRPQYLGSKHRLIDWIAGQVPAGVRSAVDAFAGSQCVSYRLKAMGLAVTSNDLMEYSRQAGLALIQNSSEILSVDDIGTLLSPNPSAADFRLMRELYCGVFFGEEDAAFLDAFRANADRLTGARRGLALAAMCRAMTRKVPMGHFAHLKTLEYSRDPARVRRNPSLVRPLRELFLELVPSYNAAVFDGGSPCRAVRGDAADAVSAGAYDLAYFDPPYCGSHSDYQSFYHVLETFVEYWHDRSFVNSTRRYWPPRTCGFDRKSDAMASFRRLLDRSERVPFWIVSYNDRSFPGVEEMTKMLSERRSVRIAEIRYDRPHGGRGSVAGSREMLFVCSPESRIISPPPSNHHPQPPPPSK